MGWWAGGLAALHSAGAGCGLAGKDGWRPSREAGRTAEEARGKRRRRRIQFQSSKPHVSVPTNVSSSSCSSFFVFSRLRIPNSCRTPSTKLAIATGNDSSYII
ncbi:hypothetical protein BN1708_010703 [Verticillium longisporum]|uniref:Secreted protein n=1 Tax=Verticillium longisporum TaxID=100787 RepID=A0A0G4KTD9_VERLO|nr:hypothetical protein BN1708_010703 [Verticillium longisporum]